MRRILAPLLLVAVALPALAHAVEPPPLPPALTKLSVAELVEQLPDCKDERCPAFVTLVKRGPAVWPDLKVGIDSPREMTRFWSLMVLGQVPIPETRPLVIELLKKDFMVRIRAGAAYVLGAHKVPEVVPPLVAALSDADVNVRLEAATALGRVPHADAVKPLLKTLRDKDQDVRTAVIESLAVIGGDDVVMPIIRRLQRDRAPMVRGMAAIALGNLRAAKGVGFLVERVGAEQDIEALAAVCWALGELGDAAALEALSGLSAHSDARVKAHAAEAAQKITAATKKKETAPAKR